MTQATMYPGFVNSPDTTLSSGITNSVTTIPVTELGVFPAAPNIAVIGTGDYAETILYTGKSAATGAGNLTGVTREWNKTGVYGAKAAWLTGEAISRNVCAYDLDTFKANIEDLVTSLGTTNGSITTLNNTVRANQIFFLDAGGCMVPVTSPATLDQAESSTNKVNYIYAEFAKAGTQKIQWIKALPADLASLTFTATIKWLPPAAASGNAKWVLKAKRFTDNTAMDTALAEVTNVTDAYQTQSAVHVAATTSAFTISGTGNLVVFELSRDNTVASNIDDVIRFLTMRINPVVT